MKRTVPATLGANQLPIEKPTSTVHTCARGAAALAAARGATERTAARLYDVLQRRQLEDLVEDPAGDDPRRVALDLLAVEGRFLDVGLQSAGHALAQPLIEHLRVRAELPAMTMRVDE